jgi:hypothetical protein
MHRNSSSENPDLVDDIDDVERSLQARADILRSRRKKEAPRIEGLVPAHPVPEYRGPRLRLFARSGEFPRAN